MHIYTIFIMALLMLLGAAFGYFYGLKSGRTSMIEEVSPTEDLMREHGALEEFFDISRMYISA